MAASSSRQARSRRLLALIDQFTPELRMAFLKAIDGVKNNALIGEIARAIQDGDPLRAVRIIGLDDVAMRPLIRQIETAFETGGVMVADSFPVLTNTQGIRTVFRFDVRDSRAEAWLRDHSSDFVTRITDEQLAVIRNTITEGVTAGTNPRTIALDLVGRIDPLTGRRGGGVIGLSQNQAQWVLNAQAELSNPATASNWFTRERRDARFDATVQRSIDDGVALDGATIDKLTGRYSDSLLQLRGETIARTEALASLNQSQNEAFQQAIDDGLISPSAVKRIWDASGDNRVRESHQAMNGQAVGMNEPFVSPVTGARMMHPGDHSLGAPAEEIINCRCRIRVDVDFLAGVE